MVVGRWSPLGRIARLLSAVRAWRLERRVAFLLGGGLHEGRPCLLVEPHGGRHAVDHRRRRIRRAGCESADIRWRNAERAGQVRLTHRLLGELLVERFPEGRCVVAARGGFPGSSHGGASASRHRRSGPSCVARASDRPATPAARMAGTVDSAIRNAQTSTGTASIRSTSSMCSRTCYLLPAKPRAAACALLNASGSNASPAACFCICP